MGSYVKSNLMKGEKIVYQARLHWIIFVSLNALLMLFISPLIKMLESEFAITDRRVIIKEGIISRRTIEMNLKKIETINVDQSILGRILGYGTITIIGTGGTKEAFPNISRPLKFRKCFHEHEEA